MYTVKVVHIGRNVVLVNSYLAGNVDGFLSVKEGMAGVVVRLKI